MNAQRPTFKRIVLGFHHGGTDRGVVGLAAELADKLAIELCGLFLADEDVRVAKSLGLPVYYSLAEVPAPAPARARSTPQTA